MKIHSEEPDTSIKDWKNLSEIDIKYLIYLKFILKLTIACVYSFILGYILLYKDNIFRSILIELILLPILFYPTLIIHELIHLIFYPRDYSYLVYNKGNFKFYNRFNGELSKGRLILILIMPIILLSVIPTLLFFKLDYNLFFLAVAIINGLISCTDIINIIIVTKNMHKDQIIKINDNTIYCKINTSDKENPEINN